MNHLDASGKNRVETILDRERRADLVHERFCTRCQLVVIELQASGRDKAADKRELGTNRELHELVVGMLKRLRIQVHKDGGVLLVLTDASWLASISEWAKVEAFHIHEQVDQSRWTQQGELYNPDPVGHWSPLGNDYVAHATLEYLSLRWREEELRPDGKASAPPNP